MKEYTEIEVNEGRAHLTVKRIITFTTFQGKHYLLPFYLNKIELVSGFDRLYRVELSYSAKGKYNTEAKINIKGVLFLNNSGWHFEDDKYHTEKQTAFYNSELAWLFWDKQEPIQWEHWYDQDRLIADMERKKIEDENKKAKETFKKGIYDGIEVTYIMKSEAGIYKIGHSRRVYERLQQVTSVLLPLQIFMLAPTNREREIHELFKDRRLKTDKGQDTEFFKLEETDIRLLESKGFAYYKN